MKSDKTHDIIDKTMSCHFPCFYVNIESENGKGDYYEKNYLPFIINLSDRSGLRGLRQ